MAMAFFVFGDEILLNMMIDAARSANGLKDGNAGWDKRRGDQ